MRDTYGDYLHDQILDLKKQVDTLTRERDEARRSELFHAEWIQQLSDASEIEQNREPGIILNELLTLIRSVPSIRGNLEQARMVAKGYDDLRITSERERDEALKKLEKIKEISQVWNVVDDDATTKIIALNRIHIIAGGKT